MMRPPRLSVLLSVGIWIVGFGFWDLALAHHSQSEYDSKARVEVEGTVTKLEWKSPHAWVYVDVTDAKGEKVNWSFELPSPVTST